MSTPTIEAVAKLLNKNKKPQLVTTISDKVNRHKSSVVAALTSLFNDGLVTCETIETGERGRPPLAYTLTAKGRTYAKKL